jgi:signal transduction histidine kinase
VVRPLERGSPIGPVVISPSDELCVSKSALRRRSARFQPPRWNEHPNLVISVIVLLQGVLLAGLLRQRSRRRRAEGDARALRKRLLTAHEDERRSLARALHDDITQQLAGLTMHAAKLPVSGMSPADIDTRRSIRDGLEKLALDVHDLSYRLHPSVIDDLGLVAAVKVECDSMATSESLRVSVEADVLPQSLPKDMGLGIYRVAQEALRNAERHAKASIIRLSLTLWDGGLLLSVGDNGIGFDPDLQTRQPSLGHASMRERIDLLGGTLEIRSAPGRGTTIVAWVPIPKEVA